MNLVKGSAQQELDHFFKVLRNEKQARQIVTKSALVQARKKLSATAFVELNKQIVDRYYAHAQYNTWNGFRLCAVDGSTLRVPNTPEIITSFGVHRGRLAQKGCPMALASVYYDVLNQIVIDARLGPIHSAERELAHEHLVHAAPNDLVLFDRGYPSFWLYASLQQRTQAFCMRVKSKGEHHYQKFLRSRKSQTTIELMPSAHSQQKCTEKGLPLTPIRLRLVRVKLKKETEILITNLVDDARYPACVFKELYHLRWGIEENYKRQKQWLEIETFSGKSTLSIFQDFHAKMLTLNITAFMVAESQKQVNNTMSTRMHRYKINFAQALSKMKDTVIDLIRNIGDHTRIRQVLQYLSDTVDAVIPNRSFPRHITNTHPNIKNLCYKRCR